MFFSIISYFKMQRSLPGSGFSNIANNLAFFLWFILPKPANGYYWHKHLNTFIVFDNQ
jgi:hypothetical protein